MNSQLIKNLPNLIHQLINLQNLLRNVLLNNKLKLLKRDLLIPINIKLIKRLIKFIIIRIEPQLLQP